MSDPTSTRTLAQDVRVILVDDHPAICDAVGAVFAGTAGVTLVGTALTAETAFALVRRAAPDVAVVDISLGDGYGLDLLHTLRSERPQLRTVIFSMHAGDIYAERALRAGALAYVHKSEPTSTLVDAVRAAARGELYLAPAAALRMLTRITRSAPETSSAPGVLSQLTDREMAVFQLLGEGHSCADIGRQLHLTRKTVETYRRHARQKLGLSSVSELIQFATRWSFAQDRTALPCSNARP